MMKVILEYAIPPSLSPRQYVSPDPIILLLAPHIQDFLANNYFFTSFSAFIGRFGLIYA